MRKHLPIYYHSAGYAEEYHQTESYRASYKLNLMCRDAIREAIETHYKNNSLDEAAAHEIIEQFGYKRTMAVLANTVVNNSWDGRYSSSNKKWAQDVVLPWCMLGENNHTFTLATTHPGLVDLFLTQVRQEYDRAFNRTSVKAALKDNEPKNSETAKRPSKKEPSL